jgi:hypothetical protein
MMPTTRYGRFLWFKKRYAKRRIRARRRRRTYKPKAKRQHNRELDTSALPYMGPKVYPNVVFADIDPLVFITWEYVQSGGRGRPPLWRVTNRENYPVGLFKSHKRLLGFTEKRGKRWPRLKWIPLLPYGEVPPPAETNWSRVLGG